MRVALQVVLLAAPLLVGIMGALAAQEPTPSAAERWRALSPERRAQLEARFDALKRLDPEERQGLRRLAARIGQFEDDAEQDLSPELRARFLALEPTKRAELVRTLALAEAASTAQTVLRSLPDEVRDGLEEQAAPERQAALRKTRDGRQQRLLSAVRSQPGRFGLTLEDLLRIEGLPQGEQKQALLMRLQGRAVEALRRRSSSDPRLDPDRLERLTPDRFARAFLHLGESDPELAAQLVPGLRPMRGHMRGLEKLQVALRPSAEELLRLQELPARERRGQLAGWQRERILSVLEAESLVEPAELKRLRGLKVGQLHREAGRLASGRRRPRGERGER